MNLDRKAELLNDLIATIFEKMLYSFISLDCFDLTFKETCVLEMLRKREATTMTELATLLVTPLTTMTSIVTRMVKKGYLERYRVEEDRRVVLVRLSPLGQKMLDQHMEKHQRLTVNLLSGLNETEQEQLFSLVEKIMEATRQNE